MSTLLKRVSHLRAALIAIVIALMLPLATLAHGDDDDRGSGRRRPAHRQLHRALSSEHRSYHQYNRPGDYRSRIQHKRFHRYLKAKHRREHRQMRNVNRRWFARNRR
jgi:hypothetical protein